MARYFPPALRRRLAPLILLGGLLLLGHFAQTDMPRDQEVRFVLTPTHRNVRTVRVAYLEEGEQVSGVEFRPRAEASSTLVHSPSLKPGSYDMAIEIEDQSGRVQALSRRLSVPSEAVTIRLAGPTQP